MLVFTPQNWPSVLWIVRHGESAGNVASDKAEAAGAHEVAIAERDVDVPLSERGQRQALALGHWFGRLASDRAPSVLLSSPYLRTLQTSAGILQGAGFSQDKILQVADERLREKEFGILDGLTKAGIAARFPEQAALRARLGKFFYRPPGGESWCDVILRLRSVLDQIQLQYKNERVLIVAHQVTVLCLRYLLERLNEEQILRIDRHQDVANCSITSYELGQDGNGHPELQLALYNSVVPLEQEGEVVTDQPDPNAPER